MATTAHFPGGEKPLWSRRQSHDRLSCRRGQLSSSSITSCRQSVSCKQQQNINKPTWTDHHQHVGRRRMSADDDLEMSTNSCTTQQQHKQQQWNLSHVIHLAAALVLVLGFSDVAEAQDRIPDDLVIQTEKGKIRGVTLKSATNK